MRKTCSSPFYWLFSLSLLFLFYFNFYGLIPRFYFKKKYGKYVASILAMVVVYFFLRPTDLLLRDYFTSKFKDKPVPPIDWSELDLLTCIFFIILISTGMAIQVIRQSRAIERRALKAEAEKAQAELSFLKAQINPHFLYNTLNNIYSLSEDHHPDTSDSILKLSNLMRYITDEATQDFVPLESEVDCIRDYIDLQQLRLQENIKLTFSVTGNTEKKQIAPLILITYIENAFKYGISSHKEGEITIKLSADDDKITFFCRNKIFSAIRLVERHGIGLENTKQRLRYLYPKKHKLTISNENGIYTAELILQVRDLVNTNTQSETYSPVSQ